MGGLATGWVSFPDTADAAPAMGVRHVDKAKALEAAGLLESVPTQLYENGQSVPGRRFALTDAGRKALDQQSRGYGPSCFLLGYRQATGITERTDATGKAVRVQKSTVDGIEAYAAQVTFSVSAMPAWAETAGMRQYFMRELTEARSPTIKRIELIESSGKWVSREALLRSGDMHRAASPLTAIPAGMAPLARLRIEDRLRQQMRAELSLPAAASESTPEMRRASPASFYFATEPNQYGYTGQQPPAAAQTLPGSRYQLDAYLNRRAELLQVLDVLVEEGVMQRKQVAQGEGGAPAAGTLYSPAPGSNGRIMLGTIGLTGDPVKVDGSNGGDLTVTAPYAWSDVPAWVPRAAKKLPFLRKYIETGTVEATLSGPTAMSSSPITVDRVVIR